MNTQPRGKKWVTPEAYLEDEKGSDVKYEYYDGEVFAMTGASLNHNRINGNLFSEIKNQLKESYCDAFASDMRVKITPLEKYTYPDIVVACNDIELEKKMGLETLIIKSIRCELAMSDIYHRVEFEA